MDLFTVIIIAFGLAGDAFAVSVASGAAYKQLKLNHILRMALFFGAFQAIMPIVGWLAGRSVRHVIADYDHWAAFALLLIIGGKMIYESFKIKQTQNTSSPINITVLLTLSIATSIDALAVGLTLSFLRTSMALAVIIIGVVTFGLSLLGTFLGKKFGHIFENKIEALAGCVLIAIGVKIIIQHTGI